MKHYPVGQIEPLVNRVFLCCGCPADEAQRIGHYLTKANLTGHDSHGVIRVARYVEWVGQKTVVPAQVCETITDGPSFAVIDARLAFGQTAGPHAALVGISKAKENGVALVALRRAGHLGRIGDFAELAADAGIVSLHFVNVHGSKLVTPFGGRSRRFSTNPVAIGFPGPDKEHYILDFATSKVAEGKVLVAREGGKAVPDDSLITNQGELSGNPDWLYGPAPDPSGFPDPRLGPGALRAFGDHKGSGLALFCDLLAGVLTGSGANLETSTEFHNGMLSIYIDPKALGTAKNLMEEASAYASWIRSAQPAKFNEAVLLPGERERQLSALRQKNGIPLSDQTVHQIRQSARTAGVPSSLIEEHLKSNKS